MPKARALVTYPVAHYHEIFRWVLDNQKPLVIQLPRKEALTLRGELYAFRRAAESDLYTALEYGIDASRMREVSFTLVPEGLRAYPTASRPLLAAIAEALGGSPEPLTTQEAKLSKEAHESLQRLIAKQGDSDASD